MILSVLLISQTLGRSAKENVQLRNLKRMKMTQLTHNGFYGDIFSHGFGGFQTMKKRGFQVNKNIYRVSQKKGGLVFRAHF